MKLQIIKLQLFAMLAALALTSVASSAATPWQPALRQSTLIFTGIQAGAEFTGVFETFTADIRFDPHDLPNSRLDVTIDVTSVNTRDQERDAILRGGELFNVAQYPRAHYVAERFTDLGGGKYAATGKLTLRNTTREVPIEFTFRTDAAGARLTGSARLKRLDFGVGQGEWQDTQWVANEVRIQFALQLQHPST